jgi:hypothetical protein
MPGANDTAAFPSASTVVTPNLTANASVLGITIDNSGMDYSITQSGGTWTMTIGSGGIWVNTLTSNTADTTTIAPNIALAANETFGSTSNTGLTTMVVSGTVSGGYGLTKTDSGTVALSNANRQTERASSAGRTKISQFDVKKN